MKEYIPRKIRYALFLGGFSPGILLVLVKQNIIQCNDFLSYFTSKPVVAIGIAIAIIGYMASDLARASSSNTLNPESTGRFDSGDFGGDGCD